MPPTGFFDLSLELRQMVYEHLMPPQYHMEKSSFFDFQVFRNTTMASACEADVRLKCELLASAARMCTVKIIVTDNATLMPTLEHIYDASSVELTIQHSSSYSQKPNLPQLRENIQTLVATMKKCRVVKKLSIEFRCGHIAWCENPFNRRCAYWCTTSSIGPCERSGKLTNKARSYVLNTLNDGYVPIVEYLLTTFVDLPAYESVNVKPIPRLDFSEDWPFDFQYMFRLFVTLENWLAGYRSATFAELRGRPGEMFRVYDERTDRLDGLIRGL